MEARAYMRSENVVAFDVESLTIKENALGETVSIEWVSKARPSRRLTHLNMADLEAIVVDEPVGESFHVHHEMEEEPAPRRCATVCVVHLPGCDTEDGCIKGCPFSSRSRQGCGLKWVP